MKRNLAFSGMTEGLERLGERVNFRGKEERVGQVMGLGGLFLKLVELFVWDLSGCRVGN